MSTELNERIPGVNELPAGWKVVPIKFLFSFGKGLSITKADLQDDGINVISYGQIHAKWNTGVHLHSELIRHVNSAFADENPYALVPVNGFIFADTSEDLAGSGNCAYVDEDIPVYAGYHTITLKSKTGTSNKYLAYLFQTDAWRYQIRKDLTRVKVYSISQQKLRTTYALVPPANIQASVVSFLDEHCEAIDSAISKHQQIIEKLEEYRKAVITQAVTKGLNQNVEMKYSCIPWVTSIPEKWSEQPLKLLFSNRKNKNTDCAETNLLSLSYGRIIRKDINSNEGLLPENFSGYNIIEPNDIVLRLTDLQNDHRSLRTGLVTEHGIITSAYVTLCPKANINSEYYHYLLHAYDVQKVFYTLGEGIRQSLKYEDLGKVLVPVPPRVEQDEIVHYLNAMSKMVDDVIDKHNQLISKLQEYKQSLIYNAVTGKIDCTTEA